MTSYSLTLVLTFLLPLFHLVFAQSPEAIYDGGIANTTSGNSTVGLRIGNGGAGQSGLVKVLADKFISESVANGSSPFTVAWYVSDTTYSIEYLASGILDVGITYSFAAEKIAIQRGIATDPPYYAFRDHFLLVGPQSNPANLNETSDISTMFADLHEAAEDKSKNGTVRFLSRFDKSATNIKESALWTGIGQVPWANTYSKWYHQYVAFPLQALEAAIKLGEYTITDRGTLLSLDAGIANKTRIFKAGSDEADDPLLNPARVLVGAKAPNPDRARQFAQWVTGPSAQKAITGFKKNGQQLYTGAP
ncbi:hypothetical protein A1Q2_08068 [Trichosporon asahii var. asahii CBS 8904]|uniref:PBP domain-containing protein n=1 Tax=Trichosporon asahii var. asahii (strain CBS 8904) TaxID=1220162 RepID=K1V130_TRIAC|nr:hypothetical protein A1Q2_08068 [Trichosporon asahii var. asahii CBS 8904]